MGSLRRQIEKRIEVLGKLLLEGPLMGPTGETWETPGDRTWDVRDRLDFIRGKAQVNKLGSRDPLLLEERSLERSNSFGPSFSRLPTDKALLLTMHRFLFLVRRAIHTKQLSVDIADDEVLYKSADVVLRLGGTL